MSNKYFKRWWISEVIREGLNCTVLLFCTLGWYCLFICLICWFFCWIIYIKKNFHICSEPINPKQFHFYSFRLGKHMYVQENMHKKGMHSFNKRKHKFGEVHYHLKKESLAPFVKQTFMLHTYLHDL